MARSALVAAAGVALVACAHREDGATPPGLRGMEVPAWVARGTGAAEDGGARVFFGVGSVHGIRNPALARSTADNRARAEIAKTFTTYSATLMRDYSASTTAAAGRAGALAGGAPPAAAGQPAPAHEEQDVEQAVKTFSAASLSGVEVVEHWFHPTDGSVYALARLELGAFTGELESMQELSASMRAFVRGHAEAAFAELEAEAARRGRDGSPP